MRFTKFISVLLVLLLLSTMVVACTQDEDDPVEEDPYYTTWTDNDTVSVDDSRYRDYYQLCVYSFCDSDGDGWGDFKGIESKLDYIKELGYTGVWLSPIHPSSSYHGYNVDDYYAVSDRFGTLDDFDDLTAAAKDKGMVIMLDMVLNHSGDNNPLFTKFKSAVQSCDTDSKYYDYYAKTTTWASGYTELCTDSNGTTWYYESRFSSTMPEFNLSNTDVRNEMTDILQFWMDHGVEAFRYDAVLYFYYGNNTECASFCAWLDDTIKTYNPNAYSVGEAWTGGSALKASYYNVDGFDSYMNFDTSNATNNIMIYSLSSNASGYANALLANQTTVGSNVIDAIFSCNHDTGRVGNTSLSLYPRSVYSDYSVAKYKFGLAMLYTCSGNIFNYYGTEIGMMEGVYSDGTDSYDPTKRMAMNWSDSSALAMEGGQHTDIDGIAYQAYGMNSMFGMYETFGGINIGDVGPGGVAEQQSDSNSILQYHTDMMTLRHQSVAIMAGTYGDYYTTGGSEDGFTADCVLAIEKSYNGESVVLVFNMSSSDTHILDMAEAGFGNYTYVNSYLLTDNTQTLGVNGSVLSLPPFSVVVMSTSNN